MPRKYNGIFLARAWSIFDIQLTSLAQKTLKGQAFKIVLEQHVTNLSYQFNKFE
jgi:hypothetical protein